MLQIIYGVPGSGKSYFAVWNIKKTLEKEKDNVIIISNIENLRLNHLNLDDLIQKYGGVDGFFNVDCEFWKIDIEKKKILFIDEAQRYFNKRFFSSGVFYYFQYHRHLNIDVYLITQSYKTLPTELVVLSEVVVQAVPPSFRWFSNSFKYLIKDLETFLTVEKIDIPFKKDVASLYTSALVLDSRKKITYTQKYLIFSILFIFVSLVVLIFVFPKLFMSAFHHSDKKVAKSQSVRQSSSQTIQSSSQIIQSSSQDDTQLLKQGYTYPSGITSKGYLQKKMEYGEFLNKYRNGIVYDLSVNYVITYDKHNRPKNVYVYKELQDNKDSSDNNKDNKASIF